jgi:hypothetical protein
VLQGAPPIAGLNPAQLPHRRARTPARKSAMKIQANGATCLAWSHLMGGCLWLLVALSRWRPPQPAPFCKCRMATQWRKGVARQGSSDYEKAQVARRGMPRRLQSDQIKNGPHLRTGFHKRAPRQP